MQNPMMKINVNEKQQQVVSARELHEFLEIVTEYAKWFQRMTEYGFIENTDFVVIVKNDENPQGGRPSTDHAITIDMAKELCMIQRTEKGKYARQYFIQIERQWNSPEAIMARALRMADAKILEYKDKVIYLEEKIEKDKPKVIFADAVSVSKSSILVGELAKILKQNGIDIGQNRLFEWLRNNEYLIRRKGTDYNMPTQKSMELGLFEIEELKRIISDVLSVTAKAVNF